MTRMTRQCLCQRRALVTGGSGAIGAAICRALAAGGVHVIVHAHRGLERAQALCAELVAAGGHATAVAFDLADAEQVQAAIAAAAGSRADPDPRQQRRACTAMR